jgi:N-acetylmuramoyl-L-alanine amidase
MSRKVVKTRKRRRIKKTRVAILILALSTIIFGISLLVNTLMSKDNVQAKEQTVKQQTQLKSASKGTTITKYKVFIDPGHGGNDQGAKGPAGVLEKDVNLQIAKEIGSKLSEYPQIEVIMSRTDDTYLTLDQRTDSANALGANAFISIHQNSEQGANTSHGLETYYYARGTADSKKLAQIVHKNIFYYVDTKDRGVLPQNFEVIRETSMAGILIETGFLSNPQEEKNLTDPQYQDRLSEGIVEGILEYLGI